MILTSNSRSIVIDDLRNSVRKSPATTVLYHFCDYGERNTLFVLQSFLRQVLYEGSSIQVSLLGQYCIDSRTPSIKELSKILSEVVKLEVDTFLIVDALDEFEDRRTLLPILRRLSEDGVRVLVTSRDIPDIRDSFRAEKILGIQASRSDLELYVESIIAESDHYDSLTSNSEIVSAVLDQADGM